MSIAFQRAYPPAQLPQESAYWLPLQRDKLLVQTTDQGIKLIEGAQTLFTDIISGEILYLGTLEGKPYLTFNIDTDAHLPTDWKLLGLRELYGQLDEEVYGLVGYAAQILQWSRNSRFCPACATETVSLPETWGRKCPNCGYNSYPPVSPAILVLVHDNDGKNVLMAHKPGWGKRYGLIAGFVEPGESLEDCVRREAVEEAGIEVDDIVYMGNQPWPYPHQLMVGFSARYIGGTTQADQVELDDVRWFNRDDLPLQLPPPFSLAYMMISQWLHLEAE